VNPALQGSIEFFGLQGPARRFKFADGSAGTYTVAAVTGTVAGDIRGIHLVGSDGKRIAVPWHSVAAVL
jgi:hypothetical protein